MSDDFEVNPVGDHQYLVDEIERLKSELAKKRTKININQECTVVLFERGVQAIKDYYECLGLEPPKQYSDGDTYTGPLWEIMHLFGSLSYMGPKPPFETTIILKDL